MNESDLSSPPVLGHDRRAGKHTFTSPNDSFASIARYYDPLMEHVKYDRWAAITAMLAALAPQPLFHLDVACGTCRLLDELQDCGGARVGVDLSFAMLKAGNRQHADASRVAAVADMRALPFHGAFGLATCLFDSLNFLLEPQDILLALGEMANALTEGGLLYFDVVTEQMILEHFAEQTWTENNGRFSTTWENAYARDTGITETRIRVHSGPTCDLLERVYETDRIAEAVKRSGLELLGVYDGPTWNEPAKKSVRIDFVAAKHPTRALKKGFRAVRNEIRTRSQ